MNPERDVNPEINTRRLKDNYQDFDNLIEAQWDYTRITRMGLAPMPDPEHEELEIDPLEYKFQGRHIIGRDTPILGGVYTSRPPEFGKFCEAIVVDEKYGRLLPIYNQLLEKRAKEITKGGTFKAGLLQDVFDVSRQALRYNLDEVKEIDEGVRYKYPNELAVKIALDVFLNEGIGVCRHQALLGAYLLEKCKSEGKVQGHVSVDRNFQPGVGGHAWIRYTNSAEKIFILDPAQAFIGSLNQLQNDRRRRIERWPYEREEDIYE